MWILKNSKDLERVSESKLKSRLKYLVTNSIRAKSAKRRYSSIVVHRFKAYFVKDHTNSKTKYTEYNIVNLINFLIDNIFIEFEGWIFQQTVAIPMGINSAPLLTELFLHSYEDFVQDLRKGENKLAQSFNYTFCYIDAVLSLNNKNFSNFLHLIYPVELEVKDTTESPNSASYLELYLEHDINGTLTTNLSDKRDDFNFPIVNYSFSTVTSRHFLHMVFTCRS